MSFSNQEYLYNNLPARFRREDKDLFLKRFLQFFGETLDDYDQAFDSFFENINPDTANETWVEFWLENLFGWSWFPRWFTLADKRRLYGNFAKHLARRGTAKGIEQWLADFGLVARVYTRPAFYGEQIWGENAVYVSAPLLIVVEILRVEAEYNAEFGALGDGCWGEQFYVRNQPLFTNAEIYGLLKYAQPQAQEILLIRRDGYSGTYILKNN